MSTFSRLIRFVPQAGSAASQQPLIGQPTDPKLDVGLASYESKPIEVDIYSGTSVLTPGEPTGRSATVERLLSPLAPEEVGTIRCIGLNYVKHAKEVNMPIPEVPTVFMKPSTSLGGPWPEETVLPKAFLQDNAADYEAELVIVIGKECKNVSEADAPDYLLGYTAANDVSSRVAQFAQSQWSYSKSFDRACPVGPALVHKSQVESIGQMTIEGALNVKTVQKSGLDDLIFSVPKIISFLSQGTTLLPGTMILTGTPAGVGWTSEPRRVLKAGDEFRVTVSHGVGTLINEIVEEA